MIIIKKRQKQREKGNRIRVFRNPLSLHDRCLSRSSFSLLESLSPFSLISGSSKRNGILPCHFDVISFWLRQAGATDGQAVRRRSNAALPPRLDSKAEELVVPLSIEDIQLVP